MNFNLSSKIPHGQDMIWVDDVKKFIRLLKEDASFCVIEEDQKFMIKQIDKRAGEELI